MWIRARVRARLRVRVKVRVRIKRVLLAPRVAQRGTRHVYAGGGRLGE